MRLPPPGAFSISCCRVWLTHQPIVKGFRPLAPIPLPSKKCSLFFIFILSAPFVHYSAQSLCKWGGFGDIVRRRALKRPVRADMNSVEMFAIRNLTHKLILGEKILHWYPWAIFGEWHFFFYLSLTLLLSRSLSFRNRWNFGSVELNVL